MRKITFVLSVLTTFACGCASPSKNDGGEEVRLVVRAHLGEVRTCYEATRERISKIEGKLVYQWQLSPEGKATNLSSVKESSTITDERFILCVQDAIATWQFPVSEKIGEAEVKFPFYFRPDSPTE